MWKQMLYQGCTSWRKHLPIDLSFGYAIKTRDEAYALMNEVFEEAPWRKFHQPITFTEISRKQKNDPYVLKLQDQAPD
jgi:hypothetical protein